MVFGEPLNPKERVLWFNRSLAARWHVSVSIVRDGQDPELVIEFETAAAGFTFPATLPITLPMQPGYVRKIFPLNDISHGVQFTELRYRIVSDIGNFAMRRAVAQGFLDTLRLHSEVKTMATKKKKKAASRPKVPEAATVPALTAPSEMARPEYEPMSLNDFRNWMSKAYELQLKYAPALTETQRHAQDVLFRNMARLQREQGPQHAAVANQLLGQYNPEFRAQYGAQQAGLNTLGANVGRELGTDSI